MRAVISVKFALTDCRLMLALLIIWSGVGGCGGSRQTALKASSGTVLAVLPITVRGGGLSKEMGHRVADRLALHFWRGGYAVIPREHVNAMLIRLAIGNPYFLDRHRSAALADSLGASCLVVGELDAWREGPSDTHQPVSLRLTIRALEGRSGTVLGMVESGMCRARLDPPTIDQLVRKAAEQW